MGFAHTHAIAHSQTNNDVFLFFFSVGGAAACCTGSINTFATGGFESAAPLLAAAPVGTAAWPRYHAHDSRPNTHHVFEVVADSDDALLSYFFSVSAPIEVFRPQVEVTNSGVHDRALRAMPEP